METVGSKRSYALTWCMPNNDDDDDDVGSSVRSYVHRKPDFNDSLRPSIFDSLLTLAFRLLMVYGQFL